MLLFHEEFQEPSKMAEPTSLIIKHFPSDMSFELREELIKLFGATNVKCMPNHGKMKCTAFATFFTHENAKYALSKLHQMEVCNQRLVVEYVKNVHMKHLPHESDFPSFKDKPSDESGTKSSEKDDRKSGMEAFSRSIHGVVPTLGLDYLPSPLLKYRYPSPTLPIIANISHALAAVPKFYTQVLHLMNKMNLPAPFGLLTPAPPLPLDIPAPPTEPVVQDDRVLKDSLEVEEMQVMTSEEESELESDSENRKPSNVAIKRHSQQPKRKKKVPKRQHLFNVPAVPSSTTHGQKTEPSEVFEAHSQIDSQKRIQFNIKPTLESEQRDMVEIDIPMPEDESGFGVMAPKVVDSADVGNSEPNVESWDDSNFISFDELRKKRISHREMKTLSVFKNYDPGEPTFRLYIKNLARQVEEKDLRYIFGRFIDHKSESDRNMFDVRLMKEGRMKGQAFVTLAQEEQAVRAVKETNGFILHTKPLVVQYARSAKPKDNPQKTKGK